MSASSPGSDGGGMSIREDPGRSGKIREAARTFGLHRDTVRKMLAYSVPPGYLPSAESAPKVQAVTLHLRGAWNGPQLRPGSLLSGGGMEEVPCHDPRAGRASGTPDCFTLLLVAWRETPLFRHWRKFRQPSLARGWRECHLAYEGLRE